jgi:transglutaminase-like putative cysteine protease
MIYPLKEMIYLDDLVAFPDFNREPLTGKNIFSYEDMNSDDLSNLRRIYKIDKIASGTNTLEKVTAVMDWVHKQLTNHGEYSESVAKNSLSILPTKGKANLFCVHKSIVMNESLLSLGIKSRIISCIPRNFDNDCHVAVTVYIPELEKWCFFDPTFDTYFIGEDRNPLSIDKIRDGYCKGSIEGKVPDFMPIPIKKNWPLFLNGAEYETYEKWYSVYMAKNCFRFKSPVKSAFGYGWEKNNRLIFLNPKGYSVKNEYDEYCYGNAEYTNNINYFLERP